MVYDQEQYKSNSRLSESKVGIRDVRVYTIMNHVHVYKGTC